MLKLGKAVLTQELCEVNYQAGKEMYARILIGINEGKTLFVSKFNEKSGVIVVNVRGNNYNYAEGEYQEVSM